MVVSKIWRRIQKVPYTYHFVPGQSFGTLTIPPYRICPKRDITFPIPLMNPKNVNICRPDTLFTVKHHHPVSYILSENRRMLSVGNSGYSSYFHQIDALRSSHCEVWFAYQNFYTLRTAFVMWYFLFFLSLMMNLLAWWPNSFVIS